MKSKLTMSVASLSKLLSLLQLVNQTSASTFAEISASIKSSLKSSMPMQARTFRDRRYTEQQVELIDNYGCWCYFYDNHGPGKAEPQDEIDKVCKALHHGYDCMMIDAEQESNSTPGDSSDDYNCGKPWDIVYNRVNPTFKTAEQIFADCITANPGNKCAQRACIIETQFILSITDLYWWKQIQPKAELHHGNGFDPAAVCVPPPGLPPSPVSCCGEYPFRFAYKTLDGDRGCCNGRTYMATINSCCDNEIKNSC